MRFSIFLTLCFCYLVQNFEGVVAQATCHQCYGDNGLCNNANDQGHFTECSYVGDGVTCASVTQIGNGGANSYYRGCAEDYIDENIDNACYCFCEGDYCNVDPCDCSLTTVVPPTDITTGGTMTTGSGPVPTVGPWQCAQCLGAYGKCVDESDNGHSTTCYGGSREQCLYLTKKQSDGSYTYHRGCPEDYDLNVNFGSDGCYELNGEEINVCGCQDEDLCNVDVTCPTYCEFTTLSTTPTQTMTTTQTLPSTTSGNSPSSVQCQVCGQDGLCNGFEDNGKAEDCPADHACFYVTEKKHGPGTETEYFRYCSVDLGTETCFSTNTEEKFIFACTCADPSEPCNMDDNCLFFC